MTNHSFKPDFFEPKPVNIKPKKINEINETEPIQSILGKRKRDSIFMTDHERYGQEIPPDFFRTNYGHIYKPIDIPVSIPVSYKIKLNYWREKYILDKNL
jgi:hypothetical protein